MWLSNALEKDYRIERDYALDKDYSVERDYGCPRKYEQEARSIYKGINIIAFLHYLGPI